MVLPEKKYTGFNSTCPYKFEFPVYGKVEKYKNKEKNCWINIAFDDFKAKIYLTYHDISKDNLSRYVEDVRSLVYKHTVKAEAIREIFYSDSIHDVHGILYDLEGNTATSVSFFVTDSTNHFLSGSLYFNVKPNKDSLAPVIQFFRKDMMHLINTLEWE